MAKSTKKIKRKWLTVEVDAEMLEALDKLASFLSFDGRRCTRSDVARISIKEYMRLQEPKKTDK